MDVNKRVYISGPLTGLTADDTLKERYEAIGDVCRKLGFDPYIPHQHTDPLRHPDVTPGEVYERDREQIAQSHLVIAYVGIPSLGVGSEIEIAHSHAVPVILLYEDGKYISRMVRGNPAVVAQIRFGNWDEVAGQLQQVLTKTPGIVRR